MNQKKDPFRIGCGQCKRREWPKAGMSVDVCVDAMEPVRGRRGVSVDVGHFLSPDVCVDAVTWMPGSFEPGRLRGRGCWGVSVVVA
jgi:hypothetical protein